mmetsp:Transcript_5469/g.10413  ORF Transcript_5469/g.10413 Transcript_5469/m.10413 type:complete len:1197 (-) Transcript_5469:243-3833(-)|eukprot:CAMPEP_0176481306 /NCGR_PEP_ID=MMETSP0200_2-20121128/2748_1 /TAXON_ID=947934 /ORGANISM="Chaetoceros sp., Strain GSL56" /LENGTH=1196 /DNA_ID=CAMNT_0017877499 /DNA_START=104 /DNA_END=3694 /DNA_ORIENTATION=-
MNFQLYNANIPDDEDIGVAGSGTINSMILSQLVPEEYLFDPLNAEPTLDNLREAAGQYSQPKSLFRDDSIDHDDDNNNANDDHDNDGKRTDENKALKELLHSAEKDVLVHLSRVKAVVAQDPKLLETYRRDLDPEIVSRRQRLEEMQEQRQELSGQIQSILNGLTESMDMNSPSKQQQQQKEQQQQGQEGFTKASMVERRLLSWERALELYIYDSGQNGALVGDSKDGDQRHENVVVVSAASATSATTTNTSAKNLTMNQLLQHLCLASISDDEETLTQELLQASKMTSMHLERTSKLLEDAMEETAHMFQSYHIHLIAHSVAAQTNLKKTGEIQNKFLNHGKEALKIGHALELEEGKRYQSEYASLLLKRWWMMENLAEQEKTSGETIQVHEEVWGVIPSSSCKLDPLFTRKENSLEAAKTLKSLRTIVKCRSNVAKNDSSGNDGTNDPTLATKRFELTGRLIQRTSAELEQRLLNTFSEIYSAGGTYDFSSTLAGKRPGRLNWIMLREVSEALMSFDSGRSLLKRYVALVVSIKFPELYSREEDDNDVESVEEKSAEEDIDGTRSKLSSLFHRVCEVCTEEFKLIAHVFSTSLPQHLQESTVSSTKPKNVVSSRSSFPESFPLQVARALINRLISDPNNGMQAHINGLLESIDRRGDFDSGAKKLDTFVVVHEKAAGLFHLLKEAAQKMWGGIHDSIGSSGFSDSSDGHMFNLQSISSLIQFLKTQEMALSNSQRQGYLNLELRLLHHHCCATLDRSGGKLLGPIRTKEDSVRNSVLPGGLSDYRAPIMPLDQDRIRKKGFATLLNGLLKQSTLRQPLIHATDSLARARLMFGSGSGGGANVNSTARVVSTIFSQMCNFYGPSYLYPIVDSLGTMLATTAPNTPPSLPFDETLPPHDLGVDGNFWIIIERIHSAAKSFDRELWAENRTGSVRVWEILVQTRSQTSLTLGKERRVRFFQELEERGEAVILRALDTLSAHIHWILVIGGEASSRTNTGNRSRDGPYAVPSGSILDSTNSLAVKALTYCLRSQFVHVQAALTPQSLSAFWTALSRRVYDILVARLLQHYKVSTFGAVVLSRDVEALRSVCMLAGNDHRHWDTLRELLTLYMTPPDSLKTMLVGADGDTNSGKGMFGRVGKDQSIVFMSRRVDYRYRTNQGWKKSQWVKELLEELGVNDPTDGRVNIANYAAENITLT